MPVGIYVVDDSLMSASGLFVKGYCALRAFLLCCRALMELWSFLRLVGQTEVGGFGLDTSCLV